MTEEASDAQLSPEPLSPEIDFDENISRRDFNAELDRFVDEHPAMSAPELARAFAAHLTERNLALVQRMIAGNAYAMLAERFRARLSRIRNGVFATLDIPAVNPATTPPRRFLTIAEKIEKWREFVPRKGHKLLLEMTMAEVFQAWQSRTKRMLAEAWRAEVLRRIYELKDSDEQLVSEKFTTDDIRDLTQSIRGDMYRGNLRIAVKASPPTLPPPSRRRRTTNNKEGT